MCGLHPCGNVIHWIIQAPPPPQLRGFLCQHVDISAQRQCPVYFAAVSGYVTCFGRRQWNNFYFRILQLMKRGYVGSRVEFPPLDPRHLFPALCSEAEVSPSVSPARVQELPWQNCERNWASDMCFDENTNTSLYDPDTPWRDSVVEFWE